MGSKVSSLIDHELKNGREARRVHLHVKACPQCASVYRELRSARLSARSLRQQDTPSDFWQDVSRRLDTVDRRSAPLAARPAVANIWLSQNRIHFQLCALLLLSLLVGVGAVDFCHHFYGKSAGASSFATLFTSHSALVPSLDPRGPGLRAADRHPAQFNQLPEVNRLTEVNRPVSARSPQTEPAAGPGAGNRMTSILVPIKRALSGGDH